MSHPRDIIGTEARRVQMVTLYKGGRTIKEIAALVGYSYQATRKMLLEAGVKFRIGGPPRQLSEVEEETEVLFLRETVSWAARYRAAHGARFSTWARGVLRAECERLESMKGSNNG